MSSPAIYLPLLVLLLTYISWLLPHLIQHRLFPPLRNKRVALLIAHPDDERVGAAFAATDERAAPLVVQFNIANEMPVGAAVGF